MIADNRYHAQDAADLIQVDYEPLSVVVNPEEATQDGAPQLFDDVPNNIAFHWVASSGDVAVEAAFAEAEVVVSERIVQQRLLPTAMEPRSALAQWNSGTEELTIWSTTQNPHIARFILSGMTGVPEHKLRVIAPEVGGGFGSKIPVYADEALAGWAAMKAKSSGQMDGNAQRKLSGDDSWPRSCRICRDGRDQRGKVTAIRGKVFAGLGRVSLDSRPRHSNHFAWADVLRRIYHSQCACRCVRRV